MFAKLFTGLFATLGFALATVSVGGSPEAGRDCCTQNLACCAAERACCTTTELPECCAEGLKCCAENLACCDVARKCCLEAAPCCDSAKDCCRETDLTKVGKQNSCCGEQTQPAGISKSSSDLL